jgi:tripartite-type tricarboxylate transporter receptor subunit TctC
MNRHIDRRRGLRIAGLALAFAIAAPAALSQAWPTKPVKLVIPFPPGGASDYVGRVAAQALGDRIGQPIVVENRGGAGGTIGTEAVAKAAPDGYTLLLGINAGIVIGPHVYPKLGYDPLKDLAPIAAFAISPMLMVVPADSSVKTVQDFVAMAAARPAQILYASSGSGALPHLTTEQFAKEAKLQLVHVPYKGSGPALPDLLSGRTQMMIDIIVSALPHVQSGKLRALAVTTPKRYAALPDVPTLQESGFPGFEAGQWYGLLAPTGVPSAIIQRVQNELALVVQSADLRASLAQRGTEIMYANAAGFSALIRRDHQRWATIVKDASIQAD